MKFAILSLAMLAAASAMYIPAEEERRDVVASNEDTEKRGITDNLQALIKLYSTLKTAAAVAKTGYDMATGKTDPYQKIQDQADKLKSMLENLNLATDKNGYSQKVQNMADKAKGMLDSIKGYLGYGETEVKRDIDIVKIAEQIEAILDEIKNVFKDKVEERRDILTSSEEVEKRELMDNLQTLIKLYSTLKTAATVAKTSYDVATGKLDPKQKIQDMADKIKDMLEKVNLATEENGYSKKVQSMAEKAKGMLDSIKGYLGYGETEVKRDIDIVKIAEQIEAILDEIKNVFKDKVEERRDILTSSEEVEKRELMDNLQTLIKLYSTLKTAATVAKTSYDVATGKLDPKQKIQDMADKIKDMLEKVNLATEENGYSKKVQNMADKAKGMLDSIKGYLGYGDAKEKRDIDIVAVAEKIEAILDEIKNVFKDKVEEKRDIMASSEEVEKRELVDNLQTLIKLYSTLKTAATVAKTSYDVATGKLDPKQKIQDMADKIKDMLEKVNLATEENGYSKKVQSMADKAKGMLDSIKGYLGYGDAEEKRDIDIVAVAEKIEAILDEIKNVFKGKAEEKRDWKDVAKWFTKDFDLVKNAKNIEILINKVPHIMDNKKGPL